MIFDHDSTRQSTPETVTTSPRMVTGTVHTPLIPAPRPAAGTPRSQISELVRTSSGVCRSFRTSGDDRDREQNYHFTGARSPDTDQREAAMRRNPRKFANSRRKNRNFAITDLLIHLCARSDALTTHISSTASDHNRAAIDRDRHDHDVHDMRKAGNADPEQYIQRLWDRAIGDRGAGGTSGNGGHSPADACRTLPPELSW